MQAFAVYLDGLHPSAQAAEIVCFLAHQLGLDVLVDNGDKILGQKQRVTATGTGILNGSAVAKGDLAVFQNDHNGDGFTGLTDGGEAFSHRLAHVEHAVVTCALLDGSLVIEIEAGAARGTNDINNFHGNMLLCMLVVSNYVRYQYLGRPTRRPLPMA